MSTEVVLEVRDGARVDVLLRFLQVQSRVVERWTGDDWTEVDELVVGDARWIPFHEAVPREIVLTDVRLDNARTYDVLVPAGVDVEELSVGDGAPVGRLVRTRWALEATVTLSPRAALDERLAVLAIAVTNRTPWTPGRVDGWTDRDVAARYSLVGTHLLLTAQDARFVSLLDGPDWAVRDTAACEQQRCWPVLVADDEGTDAVLVSPIILGDHPAIAPESAGDLFDATEIDEILTLRIMTMTEAEKADARGTDPRAAAILDRCDAMTDSAMDLLHGARRPGADGVPLHGEPVYGEPVYGDDVPWWDADADARAEPEQDAVMVGGVPVAKGSRVVLRPTRRADAQDLFLAGLTATVERVYFDVDGGTHVAVALEDDPGRDLYGATGRFYYFAPDEIEPLPADLSQPTAGDAR